MDRVTCKQYPKYPNLRIGYLLGFLLLCANLAIGANQGFLKISGKALPNEVISILFALPGIIYWIFCVFRTHRILQIATSGQYPIGPIRATCYQFFPAFNLYWCFKWPHAIVTFINQCSREKTVNPWAPGFLLFLASLIGRNIDGGLSLLICFVTLNYLIEHIHSTVDPSDILPAPRMKKVGASNDIFAFLTLIIWTGSIAWITFYAKSHGIIHPQITKARLIKDLKKHEFIVPTLTLNGKDIDKARYKDPKTGEYYNAVLVTAGDGNSKVIAFTAPDRYFTWQPAGGEKISFKGGDFLKLCDKYQCNGFIVNPSSRDEFELTVEEVKSALNKSDAVRRET